MTIKLDVLLVQILHIAILFRVFKKLVGDSLTNALLARRQQAEKLANADAEYAKSIAEAKAKADILVQEGLKHKESIIEEAKMTAQRKADEIVSSAEKQAGSITATATQQAESMKVELQNSWIDGVKQTAEVVVKKLFKKDVTLNKEYLDMLVKEAGVK
jgi:F0F1-type ATP synthase membrane subunit b/b'